jgi:hypothetical protein
MMAEPGIHAPVWCETWTAGRQRSPVRTVTHLGKGFPPNQVIVLPNLTESAGSGVGVESFGGAGSPPVVSDEPDPSIVSHVGQRCCAQRQRWE